MAKLIEVYSTISIWINTNVAQIAITLMRKKIVKVISSNSEKELIILKSVSNCFKMRIIWWVYCQLDNLLNCFIFACISRDSHSFLYMSLREFFLRAILLIERNSFFKVLAIVRENTKIPKEKNIIHPTYDERKPCHNLFVFCARDFWKLFIVLLVCVDCINRRNGREPTKFQLVTQKLRCPNPW